MEEPIVSGKRNCLISEVEAEEKKRRKRPYSIIYVVKRNVED